MKVSLKKHKIFMNYSVPMTDLECTCGEWEVRMPILAASSARIQAEVAMHHRKIFGKQL